MEAVVISMLCAWQWIPNHPPTGPSSESGGGAPGAIGRLLLLVNSPASDVELAEGTPTIIMEKNRLELFQAMQAFLDGERGW